MLSFFFLPLYFATAVAYVLWSGVFTIGSDYVYVCIARTIASSSDVSFLLLSLCCVYICIHGCSLRGTTATTRHWSYTVWSTPSVLWYVT